MPEKQTSIPVAELVSDAQHLVERFGEAVKPAEYEGVVVSADQLSEVATYLRDELGYEYLTSLTAVDYIKEGYLEIVYHVSQLAGGGPFVFKARTPRDAAQLPSVTPIWRGAEFQEREAWDLMGVRFEGHPDLRRILMWEGFAGHPLRKDWKEAYYEDAVKPFKSRWPDGHYTRAEDRAKWHDNLEYPPGWTGEGYTSEAETLIYSGLMPAPNGNGMHTDTVVVNVGPQHPSTHGVFRMVLKLQGETIVDLKPVFGYLHRNHEKIGERNTYLQNMPYTDRLDYITSMSNNFGYALAVEKLMNVKPPERAEYIRVIMAELTRIVSHFVAIGFLWNDLGVSSFTPSVYGLAERERILDLFEMASGSRMMCNYFRFGGVVRDVTDDWLKLARDLVFERLPKVIDDFEFYLTNNEIFKERAIGVGVLTTEAAIKYSAAGPMLRASNVAYDLRRADPYSIYDRFDFDIVTRLNGDIYDRYIVRMEEMRQSIRILQQALDQIPGGEIQTGKKQQAPRVPAGQAYGRVEGPKGELGFYIVSDGSANPYRYHIRSPEFINLGMLAEMSIGSKIADAIVNVGSIDIAMGEVDR
jgi:NADH:ubiquinone oxidoreductase subunit D/NADH:ubiquinone oxidoreductase subunit C